MKKLYYSISEISELAGIEPHTLRYWEQNFPELHPKKNKAGNRVYKETDLTVILRIKELVQEKKYSTEGARKRLQEDNTGIQNGSSLPTETKKDLLEIKHFLNKLLEKL